MSRHPDYGRYLYAGTKVGGACYGGLPKEYARYKQHGLPYGVGADEVGTGRTWNHVEAYQMAAPGAINDGDTVRAVVQVLDVTYNGASSTMQSTVTYEFDKVPDGVAGSNVAVDISAAVTAQDVAAALIAAVLANSDMPAARWKTVNGIATLDALRVDCQPAVYATLSNVVGAAIASTNTINIWQNDTFNMMVGGRAVFQSFSVGAAAHGAPVVPFRGRPSYRAGQ